LDKRGLESYLEDCIVGYKAVKEEAIKGKYMKISKEKKEAVKEELQYIY
jgi:hypothetical protein